MTRSTNMEHVEVLERLRGVLEHGKMGDKCLIPPDLVTAAIASLSAPQPPAEAQPVGVEGLPAKWRAEADVVDEAMVERARLARLRYFGSLPDHVIENPSVEQSREGMRAALDAAIAVLSAQQPASDGGFTAADMMDARQEGRKEARQHAAEIEALRAEVERWRTEATEVANGAAIAVQSAEARAERLAEALREARDMVEDWAGYASEYFQNKHDLAGDLAKLDAALRDHDQEARET